MMKKLCSVFLILCLVLGTAPVAAASENTTPNAAAVTKAEMSDTAVDGPSYKEEATVAAAEESSGAAVENIKASESAEKSESENTSASNQTADNSKITKTDADQAQTDAAASGADKSEASDGSEASTDKSEMNGEDTADGAKADDKDDAVSSKADDKNSADSSTADDKDDADSSTADDKDVADSSVADDKDDADSSTADDKDNADSSTADDKDTAYDSKDSESDSDKAAADSEKTDASSDKTETESKDTKAASSKSSETKTSEVNKNKETEMPAYLQTSALSSAALAAPASAMLGADPLLRIGEVHITVTPPAAGSSTSSVNAADCVSVGDYDFCSVNGANFITASSDTFSGTFLAGQKYYMSVSLKAISVAVFNQGGSFGYTKAIVTGATAESSFSVTNFSTGDGEISSYGSITLSFVPTGDAVDYKTGVNDIYTDQTEDASVAIVTGAVHITGAVGENAGYSEGKVVYGPSEISVPYTMPTPAPEEVTAEISAARTEVKRIAKELADTGKTSEYHTSTAISSGSVWDNRVYSTTYTVDDGPDISAPVTVEYVSTADDKSITCKDADGKTYSSNDYHITVTHTASGDYGKETRYMVETNGYVNGYTITATTDGNGTAAATPTESGSGGEIALEATANASYKFVRWEKVSGEVTFANASAASTTFTMPAADVEVKAIFEPEHKHKLVKTDKVDSTCTKAGTEAYWTCSECKKMFSDEEGTNEIEAPIVIAAHGHKWGKWIVTQEPTLTETGLETCVCEYDPEHTQVRVIPVITLDYNCTDGDGSVYTKGSGNSLPFTFERSYEDSEAFSHFTGISVDGSEVDASNYEAVSGSVIVTLSSAYLETLETGKHTIMASFDDADGASASFTVKEETESKDETESGTESTESKTESTESKTESTESTESKTENTESKQSETVTKTDNSSKKSVSKSTKTTGKTVNTKSPKTGDTSQPVLWGGLMVISVLCFMILMFSRKRR